MLSRLMYLIVINSLVLGCNSTSTAVKEAPNRSADNKLVDIRYDLSCSLKLLSVAEISLDKLAFESRLGLYDEIKNKSKSETTAAAALFNDSIAKLESGKWKTGDAYLDDYYLSCMGGHKSEGVQISAQHMRDVQGIKVCMKELDYLTFVFMAQMAGVSQDKTQKAYQYYRLSSGTATLSWVMENTKKEVAQLQGIKSFNKGQDIVHERFYSCKAAHQSIYNNVSPAKLVKNLRREMKNKKK